MTSILPITLTGDDLGQRHHHLNSLVNKNLHKNDFNEIKLLPESSPIDRLFKIGLASKVKNIDYIIDTLKSDDLLYVSKALKSKWVLDTEYESIINPQNLENQLYPNMITTAVTKMKNWIYINLKDEKRCELFYVYYSEINFKYTIKFFINCSKDYVENNFLKIVHKINPHYFKILCEKFVRTAKIFFDAIEENGSLKSMYLENDKGYFYSLSFILKSDVDIFLDIYEKYFNVDTLDKINAAGTKYILVHRKERFLRKPELYAVWFLDMKTLAKHLTEDECKELVEKMARAKYLTRWFDYKFVEPLIKRIKQDDRAAFKKKIFVKRDIGTEVEEWPYEIPSPPKQEELGVNIFEDQEHSPYEYQNLDIIRKLRKVTKRKYAAWDDYQECEIVGCDKIKTNLDKLFDEFRFCSFEKTLFELKQRIKVESSSQNREFMMLVLVSKSGGRVDAVEALLDLLACHSNEPANIRATIIRSLVKRAFAWRLPDATWIKFLQFGRGLGLDGKPAEANCVEGLHSVVIRNFITGKLDKVINEIFLNNFSDLTEYSLSATEKLCIKESLPKMLIDSVNETDSALDALRLLSKLIDVLTTYKINIAKYPGFLTTVVNWAERDYDDFKSILLTLYSNKIGRKDLFKLTFDLLNTDSSYFNALKHDLSVINLDNLIKMYLDDNIRSKQFLRKITIYFSEVDGLAMKFLNKLKAAEPDNRLSRPLAMLLCSDILPYLETLSSSEDIKTKYFVSAIKSNAHLTRPKLDIATTDWKKFGPKFVANAVMIRSQSHEITTYVQKLLKWKPTSKMVFELSKRVNKEVETLKIIAKTKPTFAIKVGIKYIKTQNTDVGYKVWEIIKPLIEGLDFSKTDKVYVLKVLSDVESIPAKIRPELSIIMYKKYMKISQYKALPFLCNIEILLPFIDEHFIEQVLTEFIDSFVPEKLSDEYRNKLCIFLYIRILIKYLLLCRTEEVQKYKMNKVGQNFFDKMVSIFESNEKNSLFFQYLDEVHVTLKYTKVFLNTEYVCCLPVMEKVVLMMQKILPMEKYFDKFVSVHLTMLYFKAVRNSVKYYPEIFVDDKTKINEGTKLVGNTFGKLISREVKELVSKYFESIIVIYVDNFFKYLCNFSGSESEVFLLNIVKGIISGGESAQKIMGIYILKERYYLLNEHASKIIESLKNENDVKTKFFTHGVLLNAL